MQKKHCYTAISLFMIGLLSACGTSRPQTIVSTSALSGSSAPYALTIPVTPADTPTQLSRRYHAPVLSFNPQANFAVLGLTSAQADQWRQRPPQGLTGELHANRAAFNMQAGATLWIDAGATLWIDAGATLWIDAGATLWTGGQFTAMPQNTQPWQQVRLQEGQTLASHRGAGIKVAVIDTGVDLDHDALQAHLADPADFKDYVDGDNWPDDEGSRSDPGYGHGTHVASIIVQFAPAAKIMPVRVLKPDGTGDAAHLASAIVFAADRGAHVINLSLGAEGPIPAVEQAIKYAEARGSHIISSAGNRNLSKLDYPASSAHHTEQRASVGSVNATDTKSSFGNYAKTLKLSAPGETIWGLAPENATAAWTGTSTSTAMTSGSLALALGEPLKDRQNLVRPLHASGANLNGISGNAAYQDQLGTRLDVASFLREVMQR